MILKGRKYKKFNKKNEEITKSKKADWLEWDIGIEFHNGVTIKENNRITEHKNKLAKRNNNVIETRY